MSNINQLPFSFRIAFSGKAGSGKDTCANYLSNKLIGIHLKFADKLYQLTSLCQNFLNFPVEKDRQLLHFLGTEWARNKNPDVWCNLLKKEIEKYDETEHIFISDLRFRNEKQMLQQLGFYTIRIDRFDSESLDLSSETELDCENFDYYIDNNSTKQDLYRYLDEILEDIVCREI